MRRIGRDAGTGLVEVLVAMALVFLLVVGGGEMLALSLRAKRRGDLAAAVTHAVLERLESLKALPFDDPGLAAGDYAATVGAAAGTVRIEETWVIADEGYGLKAVRLRARPSGSGGPATAALLFISRDLGFRP